MSHINKIYGVLLFLYCFSGISKAETMVLIHGYLSDSSAWKESEMMRPMIVDGWRFGGNYHANAQGVVSPPEQTVRAKGKVFFTIDLPYDANIAMQTMVLGGYLHHLYSVRKEPMILVGHSAGGVVARAYTTVNNGSPVKALITIASPHLGTPAADLSKLASKTPLNLASRFLGIKNFKHSAGIFFDLKEEEAVSGNYLYWLNRREHPANIHYFSVIRNNKSLLKLDVVVPSSSQNMNNVKALAGRSYTIATEGSHFLKASDGGIVRQILQVLETLPDYSR